MYCKFRMLCIHVFATNISFEVLSGDLLVPSKPNRSSELKSLRHHWTSTGSLYVRYGLITVRIEIKYTLLGSLVARKASPITTHFILVAEQLHAQLMSTHEACPGHG